MAIDSKHPSYLERLPDWIKMRDTYDGQRKVKSRGKVYLPPTSGHIEDGFGNGSSQPGQIAYDAYITRAYFHEFVAEAVRAAIGVMHQKSATIKLPPSMEYLRTKASLKGESLQLLLRNLNVQQLITGRVGLLADLPPVVAPGEDNFYLVTYKAENIINWDEGADISQTRLRLVVLEETSQEMQDNFEWELVEKYRILELDRNTGTYKVSIYRNEVQSSAAVAQNEIVPSYRGRTVDKLPFVFLNPSDIESEPEKPPLLGLADLSVVVYRLEADYRQSLFMQGQDTLVTIGSLSESNKEERRIGAGSEIELPMNGDAKFIGVDSRGLPEMRTALENDKREAGQKGGQLLDTTTRERESGGALRTRMYAQTATLQSVAIASAAALETILKQIAEWTGADSEEVEVKPNLDFSNAKLDGRTFVDLVASKNMGLPLSAKSLHQILQSQDLTQMGFEEELAALQEELILGITEGEETPPGPDADN